MRTSQRSAPFPLRILQVMCSKEPYTGYCKLLTSGLRKGQSAEIFFLWKALSDRTVRLPHPYSTKRFYVSSGGLLVTNPYNLLTNFMGVKLPSTLAALPPSELHKNPRHSSRKIHAFTTAYSYSSLAAPPLVGWGWGAGHLNLFSPGSQSRVAIPPMRP